jgi:hypothetical protein
MPEAWIAVVITISRAAMAMLSIMVSFPGEDV